MTQAKLTCANSGFEKRFIEDPWLTAKYISEY